MCTNLFHQYLIKKKLAVLTIHTDLNLLTKLNHCLTSYKSESTAWKSTFISSWEYRISLQNHFSCTSIMWCMLPHKDSFWNHKMVIFLFIAKSSFLIWIDHHIVFSRIILSSDKIKALFQMLKNKCFRNYSSQRPTD